jgi:hypothetical protein
MNDETLKGQFPQSQIIYQRFISKPKVWAEEYIKWGADLSPSEQKMVLEATMHLPEPQLLKMMEALQHTPGGRLFRHMQKMEEYESSPQMTEIMMTFFRMCTKVDEKTANVLDVIRSEYLQFHKLEPTTEEGHNWPLSKSAQSLFSSPKVDHAFRLRAERYIRLIYKCVQPTAATPLSPTGAARPS